MSTLPDGRKCIISPDRVTATLTYIGLAASKLPAWHPAWVLLMEAGTLLHLEQQEAMAHHVPRGTVAQHRPPKPDHNRGP